LKKFKLFLFFFFFFLLLYVFLSPLHIFPAEKNKITNTNGLFAFSDPAKQKITGPNYFSMILNTILILGVFTLGLYYLFKYIAKKQGLSLPSLDLVKVITSVPIGTNKFIQIIEVGNKYFLIGATENNISLISEITDKETISSIKILKNKVPSEKPNTDITFRSFLNNVIGSGFNKVFKKSSPKYIEFQKKRLKNLKL